MSYKEKLLNLFGEKFVNHVRNKNLSELEIMEDNSEWKPRTYIDWIEIPILNLDWDQWSKSWRKTLVITLLGKNESYEMLDNYIMYM